METPVMSEHLATRAVKHAAAAVKELEPLGARKNVFLAFVLGFVFGPLGAAIYFKSPQDFFICLAMLIAGFLFFGIGVIPGWLFSACYAAWRAHTSNEKLGYC
jgi:hypothetical protein